MAEGESVVPKGMFYGMGNFIFWERGGHFQELGHHPLFGLLVVPWNCHGASECVI